MLEYEACAGRMTDPAGGAVSDWHICLGLRARQAWILSSDVILHPGSMVVGDPRAIHLPITCPAAPVGSQGPAKRDVDRHLIVLGPCNELRYYGTGATRVAKAWQLPKSL
jgi:hypothetical protein